MFVKKASADQQQEAAEIMDRIYQEQPDYWPHGLSMGHFDGGVYLVKTASGDNAGFVGWQERDEIDGRTGYYSVGILPEHRRQGHAKRAVDTLIREKRANVDRVVALIRDGNEASLALRQKLDGEVDEQLVKYANKGKVFEYLSSRPIRTALGASAAGAAGYDQLVNNVLNHGGEAPPASSRWGAGLFNTALLAGGIFGANKGKGLNMADSAKGLTLGATGLPIKDLAIAAFPKLINGDFDSKEIAVGDGDGGSSNAGVLAGGLLGLGALGAGGLGLYHHFAKKKDEREEQAAKERRERGADVVQKVVQEQGGRIRVTLPTKDPDDVETVIELPADSFELSKTQWGKLVRDTKRRIRAGTSERTRRQKSSGAAPQNAQMSGPPMPAPFPMSPADQRAEQVQMANASTPQTEANPEIMKAQQAAQETQAAAQNEMMALQQQQMEKENQTAAQHQQMLTSVQQELNKERAATAKAQADAEVAKAEKRILEAQVKANDTLSQREMELNNREQGVVGKLQETRKKLDGITKRANMGAAAQQAAQKLRDQAQGFQTVKADPTQAPNVLGGEAFRDHKMRHTADIPTSSPGATQAYLDNGGGVRINPKFWGPSAPGENWLGGALKRHFMYPHLLKPKYHVDHRAALNAGLDSPVITETVAPDLGQSALGFGIEASGKFLSPSVPKNIF